jgi:hypothetical protein
VFVKIYYRDKVVGVFCAFFIAPLQGTAVVTLVTVWTFFTLTLERSMRFGLSGGVSGVV